MCLVGNAWDFSDVDGKAGIRSQNAGFKLSVVAE